MLGTKQVAVRRIPLTDDSAASYRMMKLEAQAVPVMRHMNEKWALQTFKLNEKKIKEAKRTGIFIMWMGSIMGSKFCIPPE